MTAHNIVADGAPSAAPPACDRLRRYHAARWDEPTVMELGRPGRRGVLVPPAEPAIAAQAGDAGRARPRASPAVQPAGPA